MALNTASRPGPVTPAVGQRVEAELTRMLYRSAGFGLFSNFVLAIVLVAGVWTYFPAHLTLGWLAAVCVITTARIAWNISYLRRPQRAGELANARHLFYAGVIASGVAWGVGMSLMMGELMAIPSPSNARSVGSSPDAGLTTCTIGRLNFFAKSQSR